MSRSKNKIFLLGHVGQDPEVRVTQSGTRVAKFSLATNRQWKDSTGATQERTDWHRCTAFGPLAEIVEKYVKRGDRLDIEGRVEYSETVNDAGEKRFYTDIVVDELIMLGSPDAVSSGSVPQERTPL